MLTIDKLKEYGANTQEGLARCMNNEAFYLRMVSMGLGDKNFERLQKAVSEGDTKEAFEAAHALKGVIGNLSLTPIYTPLNELTELLRGKEEMPDTGDLTDRIMEQLELAHALEA